MKKILILSQEDVVTLRTDLNSSPFAGINDTSEIATADVVMAQAGHDINLFAVLKNRYGKHGHYIHKQDIIGLISQKI